MPELPEVETVARLVRPRLLGRKLGGVTVTTPRTLGGLSRVAFGRAITGARVGVVRRRGKFVVMELERGGRSAGALLVHLRMTGRLHVEAAGTELDPYARVCIALDDGNELRFVDVRRFGRFLWTARPELALGALGPEPLEPAFTVEWLAGALAGRRGRLKSLLLDQTFLAGLGNIYVDEALFRSGLHPLRASDRLGDREIARLHTEIQATLIEAIEREGSSFDAFYRTPEGRPGSYQHQFRVYGRTGKPCKVCGSPIQRLVIGQRATHVCPRCQPRVKKRLRQRTSG